MKNNRIIFIGTEAWGVPILEQLHRDFQIAIVVTKPDSLSGRGRQLTAPPIKQAADRLGLPVLQPDKPAEIMDQLRELGVRLGILVAYGRIIPQDFIGLFPLGILNGHPSLLPHYRGPAPIENIILDAGQPGFSVIRLSAAMDAGDILKQIAFDGIDIHTITGPDLYELAGQKAAPLMAQSAQKVFAGTATYAPQDDKQATYTKIVQKADSNLDLSKPAEQIDRHIRAFLGWPGSKMSIENIEVTITQAHVSKGPRAPVGKIFKSPAGELAVQTGDHWLVIDRLKPAGKNEMTGRDFLAGHRNIPGL